MKLVDILARELKEWPEGADSLAQSFGGMVFYISSVVQLKTLFRTEVSEDWREAVVFKPQWQAAVDALKAEKFVEWTGEGLPPVGTVCEFQGDCAKCPSDPWHKELHDGVKCTVIAHFKSKNLDLVAFTFVKADGNSELEQSLPGALRPIRTPEKIAAEEREQAVHAMGATVKQPPGSVTYGALYDLYDAGYRKFEILDN